MENKTEKKRIAKKMEQIIHILTVAGSVGVTNAELSKTSLRYGGHLGKLYEQGYKIDKLFLGDGLYKYTLKSAPETILVREKALTKLLSEVESRGTINKQELITLLNDNSIAVKYKSNTYKN